MASPAVPLSQRPLIPVIYGTSALFIGVGLARFSFTPIIPLLIRDEWYSAPQAQLLGAWGLAGYLLGGMSAQHMARWLPPGRLSVLMATTIALSFLVCAFPVSYPVAAVWRLAAGVAGAVLMIACTADVSARLIDLGAPGKAGFLFTGVGAGAVVAAFLMPVLADDPVGHASLALAVIGGVSLAVHVLAGLAMPPRPLPRQRRAAPRAAAPVERAILWVVLAYALDAIGVTPHAVYLVDYATREVGLPASWGGLAWGGFGLGAMAGPLVMMWAPPRLLLPALIVKAAAVALVAVGHWPPGFVVSGFVAGFFTPGIAVLVSRFVQAAAGAHAFIRYWAWATTAFALMQAASGFGTAHVSTLLHSYRPVFGMAAVALLLAAGAVAMAQRSLHRAG